MKRLGIITKSALVVLLVIVIAIALSLWAGIGAAESDTLRQAMAYEDSGNLEQAIALYQSIITQTPGSEDARTALEKLSHLYRSSGRDQEGREVMGRMYAIMADYIPMPPAPPESTDRDQVSPYQQDIDALKAMAAQAADIDESLQARESLIHTYIQADMDVEAQAAAENLVQDFAEHASLPGALLHIARHFQEKAKYAATRQLCQTIIASYPDSPEALKAEGRLIELQIPAEPLEELQQEQEQTVADLIYDYQGYQHLPDALYRIAQKYEAVEQYQDAESVYQQVIEQNSDPNSPEAARAVLAIHKCRILEAVAAGNDSEALEILDQTIRDYPDHEYLPAVIYKVGQHYYQAAFKADKSTATVEAQDCLQIAASLCQTVIRFGDSDVLAMAYNTAAACYRRLGWYVDSAACYEKVFELCSDSQPADTVYNLAWSSLLQIGRAYQEAARAGLVEQAQADALTRAAYLRLENYPDCAAVLPAKRWLNRHN